MMRTKSKLSHTKYFLLFNLLWTATLGDLVAEDTQDLCGPYPAQLIFANGMFNSFDDADRSRRDLNDRFRNHLQSRDKALLLYLTNDDNFDPGDDDPISSKAIAYNTNESALDQLQQVVEQNFNSGEVQMWKYLAELSGAPEWFVNAMRDIEAAAIKKQYWHDHDFQRQMALVKFLLESETNVLVVAHSQGNFYANALIDQVNLSKHSQKGAAIKMIGVADPANYVAGGGPYATLTTDSVIAGIPNHLPANVSNSNHVFLDHNFLDAYLYGDLSGALILDQLESLLKSFPAVASPKDVGLDIYDPSIPRYLDPSLLSVVHAAQKWAESGEQIPRGVCLGISSFYQVYTNAGYFYSTCKSRNLEEAIKVTRLCLKGKEDGQLHLNPRCVMLGKSNPFVRNHEECQIYTAELRRMINAGGLDDESRSFLENANSPKD